MPNEESRMSRLKRAWDVFRNRDPTQDTYWSKGQSYSSRPDRVRISINNERTLINAIINRMAIDAASVDIVHCNVDENGDYDSPIDSGINYCINRSANIDQAGRAMRQDIFTVMLDVGCVAVVPTKYKTYKDGSDDIVIEELRVGTIEHWYPKAVMVRLYDSVTGLKKDVVVPKEHVVIVENPMYSIMNAPNSTLRRLSRKLSLLDYIDNERVSGKWNMIIQLPYTIRNDLKRQQAQTRQDDINKQLKESPYGVAYIEGSEKVIQLNRPLENNLLDQIKLLEESLFAQVGISQDILNCKANEQTNINYRNGTIEPLISALVNEMRRKWIPKSRYKMEDILFFSDPFRLIPATAIADMSDKLTRNEICSSNEIRQKIGMLPSKDPAANELRNKNINQSDEQLKEKKEDQNA